MQRTTNQVQQRTTEQGEKGSYMTEVREQEIHVLRHVQVTWTRREMAHPRHGTFPDALRQRGIEQELSEGLRRPRERQQIRRMAMAQKLPQGEYLASALCRLGAVAP